MLYNKFYSSNQNTNAFNKLRKKSLVNKVPGCSQYEKISQWRPYSYKIIRSEVFTLILEITVFWYTPWKRSVSIFTVQEFLPSPNCKYRRRGKVNKNYDYQLQTIP